MNNVLWEDASTREGSGAILLADIFVVFASPFSQELDSLVCGPAQSMLGRRSPGAEWRSSI